MSEPSRSAGRPVGLGGLVATRGVDPAMELVEAARQGDVEAQGELFDRYHAVIHRYAYARLGSVADAEDVVSETFLAAFRGLPNFRWKGVPFEAWLFRIAASKVVDTVRRRRHEHVPLHTIVVDPVDDAAPDREIEARERDADLARALTTLPTAQHDVLVLRFLLGRSIADVASAMGRTEGAVKQLQARALSNLRRKVVR